MAEEWVVIRVRKRTAELLEIVAERAASARETFAFIGGLRDTDRLTPDDAIQILLWRNEQQRRRAYASRERRKQGKPSKCGCSRRPEKSM